MALGMVKTEGPTATRMCCEAGRPAVEAGANRGRQRGRQPHESTTNRPRARATEAAATHRAEVAAKRLNV